jgi:hypothetical protein
MECRIASPFFISDGSEWLSCCPLRSTSNNQWGGVWVGLRVGLNAMEKRKIVCLCLESYHGHAARSVVSIPTEISRLLSVEW